jgi:hypothetical protein
VILADVMDELAMRLRTIPGLEAFGWPVPTVIPPAALVYYPKTWEYLTYGNEVEAYTLDVVVVVGKPDDRPTRQVLSDYLRTSGPTSVIQALQVGQTTTFDVIDIQEVEVGTYQIAGVTYLAIICGCKISGSRS